MEKLSKKILITTFLLGFFLITISTANATNVTLNPTDEGGIAGALNTIAEDGEADNTIILNPGTYNKSTDRNNNINFNNMNLTIKGNGSKNSVIIDALKFDRIFEFRGNFNLTLINITFINGNASQGGAIITYHNGIFKIIDCEFNNNYATSQGGAIWNYYPTNVVIINSNFNNNYANNGGGAIFNYLSDYFTVNNSSFTNNSASQYGGAIFNQGGTYFNINNTKFAENKAENGGAIYNNGLVPMRFFGAFAHNLTINNSNFTNNTAANGGAIWSLMGNNMTIISCNFIDNSNVIYAFNSPNSNINYNRIFNNTGYDVNFLGDSNNVNIDYNWWGDNNPGMNKILGIGINNYFVVNFTNLTSLDSNGTVKFQYIFKLNNTDSFNSSLLPYFITEVYTNLTTGVITSFDARFNNIFDITVNSNGAILYTFVDDNEIQTLAGTVTIPDPVDPDDPDDPDDPVDPVDPTPTPNNNKKSNNPTANAVMKETGMPINLILVVLLSVLGLIIRKKQN